MLFDKNTTVYSIQKEFDWILVQYPIRAEKDEFNSKQNRSRFGENLMKFRFNKSSECGRRLGKV